ncbi:MAM and LDL-receptor class A domain-containing protein 1-like [Lampetra planeri]
MASGCDDNFLFTETSGEFHSINYPQNYEDNTNCRWIIQVPQGHAIDFTFSAFSVEFNYDFLRIYSGLGEDMLLRASLTGTENPGLVRLFSNVATVEFSSDVSLNSSGFAARYSSFFFGDISNKELIDCTFESGWCYWEQDPYDSADWERLRGPSSPQGSGPDVDHTVGNATGYYIRGSVNGVAASLVSQLLAPQTSTACFQFWYHMHGVDVYRLTVFLRREGAADSLLWQKEGNYGNQWHYGQIAISQTQSFKVVVEARRRLHQLFNEIALDDVSLIPGVCPSPSPEPPIITTTAPPCPPGQFVCADISCVPLSARCDGINDCNDASDEASCNSGCDDNFLLTGMSGSFNSMNFPGDYIDYADCRWIIRAPDGYAVQISFSAFALENRYDFLKIYKGLGPDKELQASLTGTSIPGDVRVFSHELTVEFTSDMSQTDSGFSATFTAVDFSGLTNKDLVDCTFESGWCFWDQDPYDSADWERLSGPSSPPNTGPDVDHTFGNSSGFYIRNQNSGVATSIRTFTLDPEPNPTCLKFWFHMYGVDVYRLSVSLRREGVPDIPAWLKEGNYGNVWHFGQLSFIEANSFQVVFEARRRAGSSEIALDDISLEPGVCPDSPYSPPTPILPTTPPCSPDQFVCGDISCIPLLAFCDGVNDCNDASDEVACHSGCDDNFLLTGTSGSFNSMNFPENYVNNANCRWIIRAPDGYGVQISFSAFDLEHNYDFLKIYKGLGADKELQASLTGASNPGDVRVFAHELTVEFTSDSSEVKSGFNASFSAFDFSALTNKDLVDCSFESGWCYWDQDPYDSANWERLSGPSSPATTGPDVDHTFGNSSGFYIRNQNSGVATSIRTFTLDPEPNPTCLKFWYYMYGVDVYRLSLSLRTEGVADVPLWQNEGNYGNQWHYGQLNFSQSQNFQVVFEARRRSGSSEIALDDISLEPGACPELPYPPPTPIIPTTPPCPAGQFVCADISCIPLSARCDGVNDCNDASDEASCTSGCDDNFLFTGTSGSFNSMNFPGNYDDNANCRWLIRAPEGYAVQFTFSAFALENQNDFFNIYKGIGAAKERLASLTGVSNPGDVRAFAHELTVEFTSNGRLTYGGFSVSFSAFDFSGLTNKELVDCTFESGWCYWDQDPYDSADWQRLSGPSSPATTGPDVDHTLGNSSGFYIRNQNSGVATSIRTFTLDPEPSPTCLKFWFHMNGVDVYRLSVSLRTEGVADVPLWVMEGNYGNQWHYGQLNFSQSQNFQVVFEARRRSGSSEIALDDISLEPGACPELPYPLPTPIIPTTPPCPAGQFVCADISCIPLSARCDGVNDCNDASDEISCTSGCDDNFQFTGTSGSFNSMNFPGNYEDNANCRWLIRAPEGYAVQFTFSAFELEDRYDFVNIYKGIGAAKERLASLTGRNNPGDVRAFANELTVEFTSDSSQVQGGFSVSFTAFDFSQLTNKELVDCSFESGWCYWDQDPYDSADWEWLSGPSSPASTGPDVDHTFGNSSGFYIRNQNSGTATSIRTFTLDPEPISTCLKFWYHMYGRNVYRLSLSLRKEGAADVPLWSKEGNYGNQWHYGQLSFMEADNFQVVFEARRRASESEIALDDISLEPGACPELPYPEPTPFIITTPVPTTTPPPPPRDCDGPHELREPNVTFTSPRFPFAYMDNADCTWYLLADEGKNVLLHFSVFSLENNYDYVELRDGYGSDAPLIGRYTGSGPREDVFSTASAMTVRFTSDSSINSAGFNANFSTGVRLGMPPTCAPDQFQCQDLECVAREAVCDRNVDCSDGSDEKNCVRLQNRVGPSGVAQFLVDSQWHSVCSSAAWITQFNAFVCLYTGYPGANSSSSVGAAGYGPYVVVSGNSITNIQLTPSVSCPTNQVVQTNCNPWLEADKTYRVNMFVFDGNSAVAETGWTEPLHTLPLRAPLTGPELRPARRSAAMVAITVTLALLSSALVLAFVASIGIRRREDEEVESP